MKISHIDLDDDEMPSRVHAELTLHEAVFLAKLTGKQTRTDANNVLADGSSTSSGIYHALAGVVFNRFYEGGVDEAARAVSGGQP